MSVVLALFSTGVMRPPSGIDTASATLMFSLYVMPLASGVHAVLERSCVRSRCTYQHVHVSITASSQHRVDVLIERDVAHVR